MMDKKELSELATAWIEEAVRDTGYRVGEPRDFSRLHAMSAEEFAGALMSIESVQRDRSMKPLLPPRLPLDVAPMTALSSVDGIAKVSSAIMDKFTSAHPAVFHALMAHAMNFDDDTQRADAIKALSPVFKGEQAAKRNNYYQPTLFQMSMLHPEWFDSHKNVRPTVRGAKAPTEAGQGMTTALIMIRNEIRINPAEVLTHPRIVKQEDAIFTETAHSWATTAEEAFMGPNPLATSVWAMGFGDKETFWNWIPPGAALFSPLYSNTEVDALFANAVAETQPGFYLRMGAGIADILPFEDDSVLASYVNTTPLFDAPISFGSMLAIKQMVSHPGCSVGLPDEWGKKQYDRYATAKLLDIVPADSTFYDGAVSAAPSLLGEVRDAKSPEERYEKFYDLVREVSKGALRCDNDPGLVMPMVSPKFEFGTRLFRGPHTLSVSPPSFESGVSA